MSLFHTSFETILFVMVILFWISSEIIGGSIIPMLRRSGGDIERKDTRSNMVLHLSMYAAIITAILLALKNIAMLPDWLFYPGILLIVSGIFVRQWAIFILGRFFTTTVSLQKNQKVVNYGPYRYIRHPSYLGIFITITGIGVALRSWGAILAILALNGLAIGYRIYIEEKFLVSELGDDYVQYMKRTKRLIPFVL